MIMIYVYDLEILMIVIYSVRELSYSDLFSVVVKTYILYLSNLDRYCAISMVTLSAPPAGNILCTNAIFVIYLCQCFFFLHVWNAIYIKV